MPVYEYYCSACQTKFEALRPMSAANDPMACESCGGNKHVNRTLSTFARMAGGSTDNFGADNPKLASLAANYGGPSAGGGCCGGACGCG